MLALVYALGVIGGGLAVGALWPFLPAGLCAVAAAVLLLRAGALLRPQDRADTRHARAGLWLGLLSGLLLSPGPVIELVDDLSVGRLALGTWVEFGLGALLPLVPIAINAIPLLLFARSYQRTAKTASAAE